jgi:hypothetical protein
LEGPILHGIDLQGAKDGGADVGDDVFRSNSVDEISLSKETRRLLPSSAKHQGAARAVKAAGKLRNSEYACRWIGINLTKRKDGKASRPFFGRCRSDVPTRSAEPPSDSPRRRGGLG